MNLENISMADVVGTIEGALFAGWAIGILLWVLRYLVLDLPRTGGIFRKGGE